jgi:hypothetical protein
MAVHITNLIPGSEATPLRDGAGAAVGAALGGAPAGRARGGVVGVLSRPRAQERIHRHVSGRRQDVDQGCAIQAAQQQQRAASVHAAVG